MAVYNGELYVAGEFDSVGGKPAKNIAKYDGSKWSAVGKGITGVHSFSFSFGINVLTVYKNELYPGGDFNSADGKRATDLVKWDGMKWSPVDTDEIFFDVNALAVYKGELYAAGENSNTERSNSLIARWNGTRLDSIGIGADYNVSALCVYKEELYVGGAFDDTIAHYRYISKMPRWNGAKWSYGWIGMDTLYGKTRVLFAYNGNLYAGGIIGETRHDTEYSSNVAVWNDKKWHSMGKGLIAQNTLYRKFVRWNYVYCFSEYNGNIYVGEDFNISGDDTISKIGEWDGFKWLPSRKRYSGF